MTKHNSFPISTALLWACTAVLATWGAAGWFVTLHDQSLPMAVLMSATFAVAPIMAAVLATLLPRVSNVTKLIAVVVIAAFVSMDALGNARAFFAFEEAALSAELTDITEQHEADLKRARDRVDAAQAKYEAVPTPSVNGEIRRASTYELIVTPIIAERDEAQVALEALEAKPVPAVEPLAPPAVVWAIFSAISLGIVVAFFVLADAKHRAFGGDARDADQEEQTDSVRSVTEGKLKTANRQLYATRKDRAALRRRVAELEAQLELAQRSGGRLRAVAND